MKAKNSYYDKLITMYLRAPINKSSNPSLHITQGKSKLTIDIKKEHFHSAHYVHGAIIFKLLDDSAYFAAQSIEHNFFVVTSSFTTYFIRPVNNGSLTAKGNIISQTKSRIIAESVVTDNNNKLVAHGSGTFACSRSKLDDIL
jgi:uncharacterized protein (TIGR00369 family)